MAKFWTIGIGLTTETDFMHRLFQLRLSVIPKQVQVIDIRRKDSRSRNGSWCYQRLLCKYKEPDLANHFGSRISDLYRYSDYLKWGDGELPAPEAALNRVLNYIKKDDRAVVLVCSCGKAFKKNGMSWNCHRVPLALELLKDLDDDWEVEHL